MINSARYDSEMKEEKNSHWGESFCRHNDTTRKRRNKMGVIKENWSRSTAHHPILHNWSGNTNSKRDAD